MSDSPEDRILLGKICGAHGVRGDVLVQSYTARPEDIAGYGPFTDESGTRTFTLAVVRTTAKGVIAHLEGVDDRTAAEALEGTGLYIARVQLPETAAEEFYLADLVGLRAVTPEGAAIGEVIGVQNYGAGDILEIRLPDNGSTQLIPFTTAFVPSVDVAGGRIVVVRPVVAEDERG